MKPPRSHCPISLSLEVFGDAWTLLILRDMMFGGKRHFRELLQGDEQISSNILADRLKMLVDRGILTKADDPSHKQKAVYSLTERGIELLPIIIQIGAWGRRHRSESEKLDADAKAFIDGLAKGGPALWRQLMSKLRKTHLTPLALTLLAFASLALGACAKPPPPLRQDGPPLFAVGQAAEARLLVAAGMGTCASRKDGTWCWGQMGQQDVSPRPIRIAIDDISAVALGDTHYCFLKRDRNVACAGRDLDGELGDGKLTNRTELALVPGLSNVVHLAAGSFKTCAVVETQGAKREVYCFGTDEGRGKNGLAAPSPTPTRIGAIDDASELTVSWGLACARRKDGSVWCWGNDDRGQLGRGDKDKSWGARRPPTSDPVRVLHVNDAVGISAGGFDACVLTARGTVGCWGENSYGALGDGTTRNRSYPSDVVDLSDVAEVAAGGFGHTCARRRDGSVWCWGYRIGEAGGATTQTKAVRVPTINDATAIACGHTHACARLKNGSVVCWGNNESGQLGDGTNAPTLKPREVLGPE